MAGARAPTCQDLLRLFELLPPEERAKADALFIPSASSASAPKKRAGSAAGADSRRPRPGKQARRTLAFPDPTSSEAFDEASAEAPQASGAQQPSAAQGEQLDESSYDTESDSEDEASEGSSAGNQREIVAVPASIQRNGDRVEGHVQRLLAILRRNPTLSSPRWANQLEPYVRTLVSSIHAGELEGKKNKVREGFTGGKVQSGKTMYKIIFITVCFKLDVASFVASTYTHGTRSLQGKIEKELSYFAKEDRAPVINIDGRTFSEETMPAHLLASPRPDSFERLKAVVKACGCIMVNDTKNRMDKCYNLISALRGEPGNTQCRNFALALDEADAFQRTSDQSVQLESSLENFCKHRPLVKMYVSATLIPCFLRAAERNLSLDDVFVFYTYTDENYNGLEDLKPLEVDGAPLFIEPKELTLTNSYLNDKADVFLRDALHRKMSLALIITTSRVAAMGGIFDQAEKVLALCPEAVRVTVDGTKGIRVYPPNSSTPRMIGKFDENKKKIVVADVLNDVDEEFGDAPVVVLGYSQMIRGESFRSNKRVPTHIICVLGGTMSIEKVTQASGRASFIGKDQLVANGFDHVKILTMAADYDTMQKYPEFQRSVQEMLDAGLPFSEIFANDRIFRYATNILNYQRRSVGQPKEHHSLPAELWMPPEGDEALSVGHRHIVTTQKRDLDILAHEIMEVGGSAKFRETLEEHGRRDKLPGHDAMAFRSAVIERGNNNFTATNLTRDMVLRRLKDLTTKDYFKSRKKGGKGGQTLFWKVPDASEGL